MVFFTKCISIKASPIPEFIAQQMRMNETVIPKSGDSKSNVDIPDSTLFEEAQPEMEEPVRNSMFWIYRSFPHIR